MVTMKDALRIIPELHDLFKNHGEVVDMTLVEPYPLVMVYEKEYNVAFQFIEKEWAVRYTYFKFNADGSCTLMYDSDEGVGTTPMEALDRFIALNVGGDEYQGFVRRVRTILEGYKQ